MLAMASILSIANTVIVSGYVKFANNVPVANQAVYISVDTLSGAIGCAIQHVKYTNANGYYRDTLTCNNNITIAKLQTINCNGQTLQQSAQFGANGMAEANFTICIFTNCVANFSYQTNAQTVQFNNSSQAAFVGITQYLWKFGDGTISTDYSPLHTYAYGGVYQVTLMLQSNGCADSIVKIIPVPPVGNCNANFRDSLLNGRRFLFNSFNSTSSDSIISRTWNFGDGTTQFGNNITQVKEYNQNGVYTVCLKIESATGCVDSICKNIVVNTPTINTSCSANFSFIKSGLTVQFNSAQSQAGSNGDSIIYRRWNFGNGDTLVGNVIAPIKTFANATTYNMCLLIKTVAGCTKNICYNINLRDSIGCFANYTFNASNTLVSFSQNSGTTASGDSIILRRWDWGDSTASTITNANSITHSYTQSGIYNVCFTVKTLLGCERKICKIVAIGTFTGNCLARFYSESVAPKTVRFNSSYSWSQPTDSIIERRWNFGDGSLLYGNVVNPLKQYNQFGNYNVCLTIKTVNGCSNTFCFVVRVSDSIPINIPINNADFVRIVNLYPVPCTIQLTTLIWSALNNVQTEIGIYDVYGNRRWHINTSLLQGNNLRTIPTAQLQTGPYILKVKTMYGTRSKNFYKL